MHITNTNNTTGWGTPIQKYQSHYYSHVRSPGDAHQFAIFVGFVCTRTWYQVPGTVYTIDLLCSVFIRVAGTRYLVPPACTRYSSTWSTHPFLPICLFTTVQSYAKIWVKLDKKRQSTLVPGTGNSTRVRTWYHTR